MLQAPSSSTLVSAILSPPLSSAMVQPGSARPAITPSPVGSMRTTSKLGTDVGFDLGLLSAGFPGSAAGFSPVATLSSAEGVGALMPIEINPCRSEGDHADHCHD